MFGYPLEANFDLAKEQRRSRLFWASGVGLCLLIVWFFIRPFSVLIFQGYFLTSLSYGDSFYVSRKNYFHEFWLWKAALSTVPLHILFLIAIVGLDWALSDSFTKPLVYVPLLGVAFAIESLLFDRIADRFGGPPAPQQSLTP
jgi:hypothetical protein